MTGPRHSQRHRRQGTGDYSDEEADPWGVLIHEAAAELRTRHNELVQSFENNGFSEIDAKKQAFSEILPELRKELGNIYLVRLQWMSEMKRNPVHRKIMKTKDAFVDEDEFDPDEALAAAVRKRKFLLERMLDNTSLTKRMMIKTTLAYLMNREMNYIDNIVNSTYVQIEQLKQINGLINVRV